MTSNKPAEATVWSSEAVLELHTQSAYHFMLGKSQYSACVKQVTAILNHHWQATLKDNPYAEARLMGLDTQLQSLAVELQTAIEESQQCLQALPMHIHIAQRTPPYRIPLRFANPYSYEWAKWVAHWDSWLRLQRTLKPLYVLDAAQSQQHQRHFKQQAYDLLMRIRQWRLLKITRDEIRQQHPRAMKARKHYGELNQNILTGEKRCRFLRMGSIPI